jgi:hypothetical protein
LTFGRVRAAAAATLVSTSLVASPATAQRPNDKAAAQALFEQGRILAQQGSFAEACPKLAASLRLDPGIGTMLYLADCHENVGQTASAWAMFKEAAALASRQQDAREKVARRRAADLERRLTRIVIVVGRDAALPGLEVRRDGGLVPPAEIGAPIPIDPGIHTFLATAPGHVSWSSNVEIPSRQEPIAVNVPLLARGESTTAATADESGASEGTPSSSAKVGTSPLRTAGLVVASVGLVGVGVGAFLGLRASAVYDESNENGHCTADRCDAEGKELRSSAFDLATGSTLAFAIGGAAIVAGGLFWFLAPREKHPTAVVPVLGHGQAGLVVSRRF